MEINIEGPAVGKADVCAPILRALPEWFGIEEATQAYIRSTDEYPTFIAYAANAPTGFLTLKQHNLYSAEVYVMAVLPQQHRSGFGSALLATAEAFLRTQNVEYLQVKTLGTSHPDPGYARTREFYLAVGFRPLEEFDDLWGANPCLVLVKRL